MLAFLQTYGWWIIFGALLLLMFRMHSGGSHAGHGGGYGCGMGHAGHTEDMDQHGNMEDRGGQQGGFAQDQPPKASAQFNSAWQGNVVESTGSYTHHTPGGQQEKDNGNV